MRGSGGGRAAGREGPLEVARRIARRTVEIGYPNWDWGEGVAWHAVAEAGIRLPDPRLLQAAAAWVGRHSSFQPSGLRQVMPGLVALAVHRASGDEAALRLALRVAAFLERAPRSVHGVYAESVEIPVWIDYWYETTPFLTALRSATGDQRYADWAAEQSFAFLHACWDPAASLFHHAYYDLIWRNSQWFWARANGWAALAAVEMLGDLPEARGLRPILGNVLRRQAERLAELQNVSGLWHTVLDQPGTYLEVSASVMVALALRRGVQRGYLDGRYLPVAERAFRACLEHVDEAGNVTQVSGETWPGDLAHYQRIPLGVYPWGQGFTALACVEWGVEEPAAGLPCGDGSGTR